MFLPTQCVRLGRLSTELLPEQLEALERELAEFPPGARARGLDYADDGRVTELHVDGHGIAAVVHGTQPYETAWHWNGDGAWSHRCSCPVGSQCKHAVAVACAVLDGDDSGEESALEPIVRLREGRARWERQAALDELLVGAPSAGLSPYGPPLDALLREPDPDVRCWRLAEAIAAETQGWVPEGLKPYRQRGDVADRFHDRERAATAAALLEWARRRGGAAPRRLRVVFDLIVPPNETEPALVFETRLSTPRLHDAPRTVGQVHGLRTETLRDPTLFPPEQSSVLAWLADAVQSATSDWNATTLAVPQRASLLERATDAGIAYWSTELDAELAARGGITPGAAVRMSTRNVRLVPACVTRDGELDLELRLRWPDGREHGLSEVLYLGSAIGLGRYGSLVIAGGEAYVVAEEPPAQLRQRFAAQGPLRVPSSERVEVVGALAESFPHLRTTLSAHTHVHAVAPSVALDLRADDWLCVRAFARGGDGPWNPGAPDASDEPLFELTPGRGWVRAHGRAQADDRTYAAIIDEQALHGVRQGDPVTAPHGEVAGAPAETPQDIWLELPDPQAVEPVSEWLRRLPLADAERAGLDGPAEGWWMRAGKRALESLAEAWDERPPGVAFFGTERLRRLLGAAHGSGPKLRVRASGVDWLTVSADWEAEGLRLSDADLTALRSATGRFVKLDAGWVRRDVIEEHDEAAELLADLGIALDAGEQRLGVWQLAGASEQGLAHLERLGVDQETLAALDALRARIAAFSGVPEIPLPDGLTATLRHYQRQGLDFLAHTGALGLGAVLADDMGLGKTVQALAWLLHLRRTEPDNGPALVVCPASVVHNWVREAERFAPELRVLLLTSGKERHALRDAIPQHDLLITTYALLRRDADDWRDVELGAAILDEAQFIKNPDAAVSRVALSLQAKHRLALTGTPLENRALDLWSIMQFVNPGYLGGRAAFVRAVDRADAPPHMRMLLAAKLRPVLLRRTKAAVAPELPPRIEERRDCELSAEQRQLYVSELRKSRQLLAKASTPERFAREKLSILTALTRLRQICCHPALAGGRADLDSGKFEALFELLEPLLAEGHKVLVFSQFVQLLKLLGTALKARGIKFHQLTGATTKREQVVAAFQDDPDPCIFLISLRAGGTGLNLTAASYVVLFDPWWNPAVEAQAIDRTHRIGQDRTVIAYRMLAIGTIEERIWDLQQRKAALVRDVLGEGGFARTLTKDDLEYLLADVTAA